MGTDQAAMYSKKTEVHKSGNYYKLMQNYLIYRRYHVALTRPECSTWGTNRTYGRNISGFGNDTRADVARPSKQVEAVSMLMMLCDKRRVYITGMGCAPRPASSGWHTWVRENVHPSKSHA